MLLLRARDLELRSVTVLLRRSSVLFAIGLVLLGLAIEATRMVSSNKGVLAGVFAQGLTIAASVSMWEAIANLFLEWHPHRQNIRLHSRIMNAPGGFRNFQQHDNQSFPCRSIDGRKLERYSRVLSASLKKNRMF